jgi:hypothetical protein
MIARRLNVHAAQPALIFSFLDKDARASRFTNAGDSLLRPRDVRKALASWAERQALGAAVADAAPNEVRTRTRARPRVSARAHRRGGR